MQLKIVTILTTLFWANASFAQQAIVTNKLASNRITVSGDTLKPLIGFDLSASFGGLTNNLTKRTKWIAFVDLNCLSDSPIVIDRTFGYAASEPSNPNWTVVTSRYWTNAADGNIKAGAFVVFPGEPSPRITNSAPYSIIKNQPLRVFVPITEQTRKIRIGVMFHYGGGVIYDFTTKEIPELRHLFP